MERIISLGGWETIVSDESLTVNPRGMSEIVKKWANLFSYEPTWVQKEYEVPSLIVRLDCVVRDGELGVYEIEERPAGIGLATLINPEFKEILVSLRKKWPLFDVLASGKRRPNDDYLWATVISFSEAVVANSSNPLLIRAEPEEKEFLQFEKRSVSSFSRKGDKSYGIHLGLWREVPSEEDLPWDKPFCLKPTQGSKARDVKIWLPKHSEKEIFSKGASSRSQILRVLNERGKMYCQDFIPPMPWGAMCRILRVFFAFDTEAKKWIPMGGFWNARPNLLVHGASDSVFGPVML
ncbi:MAG: hypothetical protein Q7R99_03240 [bacterium]|nr:hypothetical protein [bacterium]